MDALPIELFSDDSPLAAALPHLAATCRTWNSRVHDEDWRFFCTPTPEQIDQMSEAAFRRWAVPCAASLVVAIRHRFIETIGDWVTRDGFDLGETAQSLGHLAQQYDNLFRRLLQAPNFIFPVGMMAELRPEQLGMIPRARANLQPPAEFPHSYFLAGYMIGTLKAGEKFNDAESLFIIRLICTMRDDISALDRLAPTPARCALVAKHVDVSRLTKLPCWGWAMFQYYVTGDEYAKAKSMLRNPYMTVDESWPRDEWYALLETVPPDVRHDLRPYH